MPVQFCSLEEIKKNNLVHHQCLLKISFWFLIFPQYKMGIKYYIISHHNIEKILSYSSHISFIEGIKKNRRMRGNENLFENDDDIIIFLWVGYIQNLYCVPINVYIRISSFTNKEIHFLQLENPFNEIAFSTHTHSYNFIHMLCTLFNAYVQW